MKSRCLAKLSDSEDLDELLPDPYGRPGKGSIQFTTRNPHGCSVTFWKSCSCVLFFLLMIVCTSWILHTVVFANSEKTKPYTLDTTLFLDNSQVSDTIKELQAAFPPGLRIWNNGTIDLVKFRMLLGALLDKNPEKLVIPKKLSQSLMHHMPDFLSQNFEKILADSELHQGFMELLAQKPVHNVSDFLLAISPGLKSFLTQIVNASVPDHKLDPNVLQHFFKNMLQQSVSFNRKTVDETRESSSSSEESNLVENHPTPDNNSLAETDKQKVDT